MNENNFNIMVFDRITVFSVVPVMRVYIKYGKMKIEYLQASAAGMFAVILFQKLHIINSGPVCIATNYLINDSFDSRSHSFANYAGREIINMKDKISVIVGDDFHKSSIAVKKLISYSVLKYLGREFVAPLSNLLNYASSIKLHDKKGNNNVFLISSKLWLFELMGAIEYAKSTNVIMLKQQIAFDGCLFSLYRGLYALLYVCYQYVYFFYLNIQNNCSKRSKDSFLLAAPAVWGLGNVNQNDLFWHNNSEINLADVLYYFDRKDVVASKRNISEAIDEGVSAALFASASIDRPLHEKLLLPRLNFGDMFHEAVFLAKFLLKSPFLSRIDRKILVEAHHVSILASYISNIYSSFGIKGSFHSSEESHDFHSLASEYANSTRFGVHWSYFDEITSLGFKGHQVFFYWGKSSLNSAIESGAFHKYAIITGCYFNDFSGSNKVNTDLIEKSVDNLRNNGCKIILTIFDSSSVAKRFLSFFMQWILDDQSLGILIKPKKLDFIERNFSDNHLVDIKEVLATKRVVVLDRGIHPSDASQYSDYSIGITSPSALIMSGVSGNKCIYFDYQHYGKQISSESRHHTILHSLGENRCVFYDLENLKKQINKTVKNPKYNPLLGDMSSIVDEIDPYRDGKASIRVGEFIYWYIGGLKKGFSRDKSLEMAARNYANKWGENKVITLQ